MEWYYYLIIIIAAVAVFLLLFTLGPAILVYKAAFGRRQDKNPHFRYFTPEDFNLTVEHMPVRLRGVELAANLYTTKPAEECERVVIFQHGFGAGTSSYMTEIAHFARQGFAVVAVDALGCNNSAGKNIRGFYAGAEAVIAAYIGVNCDESDMLKTMGSLGSFYAPLTNGWIRLINFFKFGSKGNMSAAKAVEKSGVKSLLIHGEKDGAVGLKNSAANKVKGENVTALILPDKKHNPYNTVAAEDKLAELTGKHTFASAEEEKAYYENFDWNAVTEEDEEVMSKIDSFIENV